MTLHLLDRLVAAEPADPSAVPPVDPAGSEISRAPRRLRPASWLGRNLLMQAECIAERSAARLWPRCPGDFDRSGKGRDNPLIGGAARGRGFGRRDTCAQPLAHTKAPEGTGGRTAGRCAPAPNKSGVDTLRPGPSLAGLAAVEPGSWDRPGDRSPVRPGGSHLPLRARRTVPAAAATPQRPYPRTSSEGTSAYPRTSGRCGRHVDGTHCNARATSGADRGGVDFRGR